ncbi:MAG: type II secretion system minor pseudopilin GspJ [Rhodospirillaceae bacterium]
MMDTRGFTLVEMLVALLGFGLLSAAAAGILNLTLRDRAALAQNTETITEIQLARAVIRADLSQVVQRPVRDAFGAATATGLTGGEAGRPLLAFVRRGWDNPGREARSSLQYVEYVRDGASLVRRSRPYLDPTPETPVITASLLSNLREVSVNFLAHGQWADHWVATGDAPSLPDAVQVTATLSTLGELRQSFLVGDPAGAP